MRSVQIAMAVNYDAVILFLFYFFHQIKALQHLAFKQPNV